MKNLLRNLAFASMIIAALSFTAHQWATPAGAQLPGGHSIVGFSGGFSASGDGSATVMLDNGDVYFNSNYGHGFVGPAVSIGNFWNGASPTALTPQTWSQIKGQFAPKAGN